MTCRVCGSPIQARNRFGVCNRTAACRTERSRLRYAASPDSARQRKGADTRRRLDHWQGIADARKTALGCAGCGFQSGRPGYFDLDHVDPALKKESISQLARKLIPGNPGHEAAFAAEMAKCQVLCTACHREKSKADLTVIAGRPRKYA